MALTFSAKETGNTTLLQKKRWLSRVALSFSTWATLETEFQTLGICKYSSVLFCFFSLKVHRLFWNRVNRTVGNSLF